MCLPPASTAVTMRSRRVAGIPLVSKTVRGTVSNDCSWPTPPPGAHVAGCRPIRSHWSVSADATSFRPLSHPHSLNGEDVHTRDLVIWIVFVTLSYENDRSRKELSKRLRGHRYVHALSPDSTTGPTRTKQLGTGSKIHSQEARKC